MRRPCKVCYAEPTVNALVEAVAQAIPKCKNIDTSAIAKITSEYYNWDRVVCHQLCCMFRFHINTECR